MGPQQGRVLIVDDDTSIRWVLYNTLKSMSFEVNEAATGEAALRLVRQISYDVVLLDINMPGIDRVQTCRQLRQSLPRLSILMLTVCDSESDKIEALDAGADDYI